MSKRAAPSLTNRHAHRNTWPQTVGKCHCHSPVNSVCLTTPCYLAWSVLTESACPPWSVCCMVPLLIISLAVREREREKGRNRESDSSLLPRVTDSSSLLRASSTFCSSLLASRGYRSPRVLVIDTAMWELGGLGPVLAAPSQTIH